jgi:Ca-activated chloride channel homolog
MPKLDTMRPRNNYFCASLILLLSFVLVAACAAQNAPTETQTQNQSSAGAIQAPTDTQMDQPLNPEELTVPSNASLTAVAPPPAAAPTTATATTSAGQPGTAAAGTSNKTLEQGKNGSFTLKTQVEEVVLHATVVDEHQRLVTNLNRNSFSVFEDGQQQPITSFRHEDVPVVVGILVDNSGSMREKRPAVTQAALNFVRSSNPDDRVFIVNFDTDPWIDVDFTADSNKMKEALERIDSKGGTALYDAVVASSDHIIKQPGIDKRLDKKVLLVITDGWDNSSVESLEQAVRHVQAENGPTIYTIGLLDEDAKKKGKRALKELAEQTGGVAFFPGDLSEVDAITRQVAHDIRNQYTIGFKKGERSGPGYRSIKVLARANGYKNLQVRTRSGYFPGEEKEAKK